MAADTCVYLLCFSEPYKHARHYLGFVDAPVPDKRIKRHRAGNGAKLIRAILNAGLDFELVRTWPGASRSEERKLKRQKRRTLCPKCSGDAAYTRARRFYNTHADAGIAVKKRAGMYSII